MKLRSVQTKFTQSLQGNGASHALNLRTQGVQGPSQTIIVQLLCTEVIHFLHRKSPRPILNLIQRERRGQTITHQGFNHLTMSHRVLQVTHGTETVNDFPQPKAMRKMLNHLQRAEDLHHLVPNTMLRSRGYLKL